MIVEGTQQHNNNNNNYYKILKSETEKNQSMD